MKKKWIVTSTLVAAGVALWMASAPPSYHEPAGVRTIGAAPPALIRADIGDVIAASAISVAADVPGHDEILPIPGTSQVLVSGRDEWIWRVDIEKNHAEKLVYSPVSPTGARLVPGHPDQVYFCMARLDDHAYDNSPGLYRLDLNTRKFTPVVTRVPITGSLRADGLEIPNGSGTEQDIVHMPPLKLTALSKLDANNSRALQFCNDLDVSKDGKHIYITEPFSHPKASSGLGAMPEGITLARNGRVWRYDTDTQSVGLILENNVFADGVLIEYDSAGNETGLLINETTNFRISRVHFTGAKAGQYDILWDDLPGLPDGLDRDSEGRVWVALIKDRTALMTWMHGHPWIKPLVLRIPPRWLPTAHGTALLALSPDASRILAYAHHDGSRLRDISVVAPGGRVCRILCKRD